MAKEETKKTVKKPVSKSVKPTAAKAVSARGGSQPKADEPMAQASGRKKEAPMKVSKPIVKKVSEAKKPVVKETVKSEVTVSKSVRSTRFAEASARRASSSQAKETEKTFATVSIDVIGIDGKAAGKVSLPGEMFGEKVNKALIAQAVRVYLANQRQGTVSTKTRGEVDGSTAKIYRQKGTGRARHGSKRAPIFVKGGVVFGPKPRDFSLALPQKMKRKALFSALSAKVKDREVMVIDGLSAIAPKTKAFAEMLQKTGIFGKKQKLLFVTAGNNVPVIVRAGRNIQGVSFIPSKQINTYGVLAATRLVVMKDAIDEMKEHFLKK